MRHRPLGHPHPIVASTPELAAALKAEPSIQQVLKQACGVELSDLARIPKVVGVAGGLHKAEAILGALRGGYLAVLVTNELTALRLLELRRGAARPRAWRLSPSRRGLTIRTKAAKNLSPIRNFFR